MSVERKVYVESRSALTYLGRSGMPSSAESAGLNRSMCPTWISAPRSRASATRSSASASEPARGFSIIVATPRSRKAPATVAVEEGGHGDRDGVDLVEQLAVVVDGDGADPLGDGAGLLGPGVGDAHKLDPGGRGEDPGVVLAEVADPDDAHSQGRHDDVHPHLFAAPAVLAVLLGLDELQQALDLGRVMAVRLEDLGRELRARSWPGRSGGAPRAASRSPRR